MQNRYLLDTGDFSKFLLLKTLADSKLCIGLNWYLVDEKTEAKEKLKNNDGKHKKYLLSELNSTKQKYQNQFIDTDLDLFRSIQNIYNKFNNKLDVNLIETEKIFPNNVKFYNKPISTDRDSWFINSINKLVECDIILCDPDNGILFNSGKNNENKYILNSEILKYLDQNKTIIIYQHLHRIKKAEFKDFVKGYLLKLTNYKYSLDFLYSGKGTGRYYVFISQKKHLDFIKNKLSELEKLNKIFTT